MYFALTTYNRMQFLKPSLESLSRVMFPEGSKLIVSDDKSESVVQDYIIDFFSNPIRNLETQIIMNKINVGCDMNMVRVIREAFFQSNDQFVVTIDSDVIYNPRWIYKLLEAKSQIKENIGSLGVFNTKSHTVLGDYNENIHIKRSLGGFCALLNRDIFMDRGLQPSSWDWSYVDLCNKKKYRMFCTKKSYVDHIGLIGAHSMSGSFDVADNFVPDGD